MKRAIGLAAFGLGFSFGVLTTFAVIAGCVRWINNRSEATYWLDGLKQGDSVAGPGAPEYN